MRYVSKFKAKAITLRRQGLSYNEIRHEIPAAKSTLSLWLRAIPLKPEYKQRLYTKQIAILSLGPQSQRARREREVTDIIRNAINEIALPISSEAHRLMGAALYWAEGSKGKIFEVTNSDPCLILFMVKWIEKIIGVPAQQLKARLNIYPQQSEKKIKQFWSDLTGIPVSNFGKSYIKPLSKNYKRNNLYYGTIKIEMPKGTDSKHRVFGWVQAALQDIKPKVVLIQRKWITLQQTPRSVNLPPVA